LRQVVYGTARLGFFFTFEDALKARAKKNGRESITLSERGLAALAAGGLGAFIGNPTEVILVRMQSDGSRPLAQRANYHSALDALMRISRNEGIAALWSGATPMIVRAMSTNLGQLATFSETKHQLGRIDGVSGQTRTVVASAIAGLASAFLSLPFDFAKTRMQSQERGKGGGRV
jgi:solute carrier family 25 oxoglutarate transporter 11